MPQVRAVRRRGGKDMAALAQAVQAARGEDNELNESIEASSEISSLQDNDSDSDFEEPARRGRKRRPKPESAQTATKRARRPRKPVPEVGDLGSLYEIVKTGRAALQSVVDDWIESYKSVRDSALLELIQFFVQSSGCKGKITPYMYSNLDHTEIIRKMTEEFEEDSGDYPLIMAGPLWKKFRSNFCEFIQFLVRQCQYSIIYDQYMMDNVISLLTGLTDSQVRAFRHTSTLAAMKLMTALVDVALNLSINLDNTQRQYEAERQKNQSKRASERLDLLMTKRQELEENQEEIRNMLTYIFKGVFVHRYRDTLPDIRSICMSEIGVWMKKYPNMFLDDTYLKYIGWTLYDKTGDVRLCCLRSLSPLYDSIDLSGKLELFTNRFKTRIVEMTLDKENDVAVQAIKLCTSILKYSDAVLSDKDCENVYELVYSSNRHVAQSAAEFLNHRLFQREDDAADSKQKKGKKRSPNTPLIRDLVQFFIESELHEHGAYLVDSLWDINGMVKDWECMTDLLFEEPGKGEESLDDRQETSLIEIMVCCVKQAATGESPVGRIASKKTTKETKLILEEKSKLTEHFITTLPHLLAKYLMDPEKVANLLQVPQYFDLEIYTTSRQEKNLENLLRYLHEIVEKHTDTEVLEACSKVYECLCCEEYAIASKCNVERSTLIDGIVQSFEEAMQEFFSDGGEPDEDETFALLANLKRIHAFYGCHDLSRWNLWDGLFHIIKAASPAIPQQIICNAIGSCFYALQQYLLHIEGQTTTQQADIVSVRRRLVNMMTSCVDLLQYEGQVAEEAYISLCDLLIIFGHNLGVNNPSLKGLVYLPEKQMEAQLCNFLTDRVFIEEDDEDVDENVKIEELHKKRNFLAAFCKLIIYNVVHIRSATEMFKYYMRFYNDYGDIIKATLSKAREINKVVTAKTLGISLTQLFNAVKAEQKEINRTSDAFQSIKELARRFALSFGLDQLKNREAMAALHKEGIDFVMSISQPSSGVPPVNIPYLEVLSEFTNKLMKQDKKTVVAYLDKNIPPEITSKGSDWQPYIVYRNSLMQGEVEVNPILLRPAIPAQPIGRRGRRRHDPDTELSAQWPHSHSHMTTLPQHSPAIHRISEEEISEQGSENDFDESSINQVTRNSWLRGDVPRDYRNYGHTSHYGHMQHPDNMSATPSISDFSSPTMGQGQGHMQGGLFEEEARISDESDLRNGF